MSLKQIPLLLEQLTGSSEFAVQTTLPASSLQLTIAKLKSLSLPITPAYAKKLIAQAEMAPYGYKEQTLLDGNVRATWKITPNHVKVLSDTWAVTLQSKLDGIKIQLGLPPQSELRAELHDLLIYEPGQFFKPHQDSEKCDGMVATLVVVLPSKHQGGTLVVEHQGKRQEFHSDRNHQSISLFAFYADCRHEVLSVTSGYRIALTYNLTLRKPVATTPQQDSQGLAHLLQQHFAEPKNTELVYLLDHEYTQAGLSWNTLKGHDDMRVALFKQCAAQLELDIYLCLAEAQELWNCEYDDYDNDSRGSYYDEDDEDEEDDDDSYDDETENEYDAIPTDLIERNISLQHWLGSDGKVVSLPGHHVSEASVCWTTDNEDFDPFDSNHEGWMGNYGNTIERWYHRAAVVLWPKSAHYRRLLEIAPIQLVDELLGMEKPHEIVAQILPEWTGCGMLEHVPVLCKLALKLNDAALAHGLLKPIGAEMLQATHVKQFVDLGKNYGQDWLLALMQTWLSSSSDSLIERIKPLIQSWDKYPDQQAFTHLLLTHQLPITFKSHAASTSRPASHQQYADKRISELTLLWDAAQHQDIRAQLLQHVENHSEVYSLSEQARIALHTQQPSSLGKTVIQRLQTILTQAPRAADDWSIQQSSACKCADCAELNLFLRSNTQRKIWPLAEQRRRHIHGAVDDLGIPVTHETERRGSPYKLHLLKTERLFKDELALRGEWEKLLAQLRALL